MGCWHRHAMGIGGVFGLLAPALIAVPGPSQALAQTLDDLDVAEAVVDRLERDLDTATAAYEATWATIEKTRVELERFRAEAAALERVVEKAERLIGDRARAAFKRGTNAGVQTLFSSGGSQEAVERVSLLAVVQVRESSRIEDALVARVALGQARSSVVQHEAGLQELQARLEADAAVLQQRLIAAEEQAATIRTLVSRQRRIDRGPQRGIYSCIFDRGAFRFRDTWGAPRSGGRSHRGTDVFAVTNAPVYAITSGVVQSHSNSALGGLGLYLRGDDGNVYYYAHLNAIEAPGRVGSRVVAGERVARNGSTGNASPSAPHVHFELHPGGGGAINPYPWLAASCF